MNTGKKTEERRRYDRMVKALTPNSNYLRGYGRAFWVGGLICAMGQLLSLFGAEVLGLPDGSDAMFTSIALIFLGVLLTGLGSTTTSAATPGRDPSCPSPASPIPWPRRPSSSGGRAWCWG